MADSFVRQLLEKIKLERILEILDELPGLAIVGRGVFRTYRRLTKKQRDTLKPFVDKLTSYLSHDRDPAQWRPWVGAARINELRAELPPHELIVVSSLLGPFCVDYKETLNKSPVAIIAKNPKAFDEAAMENAAEWLLWAFDRLEAARQLTHAQQVQVLKSQVPDDALDAIELICDWLKSRPDAPTTEAAIRTLTSAQAQELAALALDMYTAGGRSSQLIAAGIFEKLSCFVPDALSDAHVELAKFPALYRLQKGVIFFNAQAPVSRELLKHTDDADGFLKALVWTRDPGVPAYLHKLRKKAIKLPGTYVEPYVYASEGGWELLPDGTRRDLVYDRAFELKAPEKSRHSQDDAVAVAVARKDMCGNCHHPLTSLLDIDLKDKRFSFFGVRGARLIVVTCNTCWDWTYTRTDTHGNVTWLPQSTKFEGGDGTYHPWPENALSLGSEARTPVQAVGEWGSYLGGHPCWIDDAYFPPCPDCQRSMMLLAHVSLLPLGGDGMVYAWFCPKCRTTATNFRCT